MKKTFKLQLIVEDNDEAVTTIDRTYRLSDEPEDSQLYRICGNMYNFLVNLNIPISTIYEVFNNLGEDYLKEEEEEGADNDSEEEKYSPAPSIYNNNSPERIELIQKMVEDPFAYKDFLEQLTMGDEKFKKGVFRAFLKDVYEDEEKPND
jgi:hypothetical protein